MGRWQAIITNLPDPQQKEKYEKNIRNNNEKRFNTSTRDAVERSTKTSNVRNAND